jgi:hypothetical protein
MKDFTTRKALSQRKRIAISAAKSALLCTFPYECILGRVLSLLQNSAESRNFEIAGY